LGAGGMGEVFRARDTRLGREVAIKVLPQHLSAQPEVRARFEREAKTVSGLNHPNICTLYDVGREGDADYLVMELIDGETLAERLRRGPLPITDVLRFGTQVADALDRAHRAGVIHRDLKPGNIMITRSGAKLMDFGLARATGMAGTTPGSSALSSLTQSPTVAHPLTAEGTIVGTFQYMSPEQLEGHEADARSDIWALGCVLYEMVTGRRAFEGRSQASLIAAILEREPPLLGEPPSSSGAATGGGRPPGMDRLIRNCLTKDPEERIQTAHDVKLQLMSIAESMGVAGTSVVSAPIPVVPHAAAKRTSPLPWGVAALGMLAAVGMFAWLHPRTRVPAPAAFRFRVASVPNTVDTFWPRVSPDGKFLLTQAGDSTGTNRAYVCALDQIDAHPVPGTDRLQRAYWSPDSREIAFVADAKIQRLTLAGGSPVIVCAAPGGADLSWGSKGLILMDGNFTDSLRVVPAGGGDLKPASRIDRSAKEVGSGWPCFLPDGEHFLFIGNLATTAGGGNIRLGRIGSLDSKLLGKSDGRVEYAPGGWVLFMRGETLLAQKLDLGKATLTGDPITLADNVRIGSASGHFSISQAGVLAFSRQDVATNLVLRAAGRDGALVGAPLVTGDLTNPRVSPDGRHLLYLLTGRSGNTGEIHVLDLERSTDTRLTFTGDQAIMPEWSPEGRRFAYVVRGTGEDRLRIGAADGLGAPDSLQVPGTHGVFLFQWSRAGSRLVFSSSQFKGFAVPAEGVNRVAVPLPDSTQLLAQQQISPDGRWLAFATGTNSNVNVYVQSIEGAPGRWQISNKNAFRPCWTRGGRELIYEGLDGRLMAVDIDTQNGFRAGTPHPLFTLPQPSRGNAKGSWCCDADGTRFYVVVPPKVQRAGTIEVVTSFQELVSRK
jgi:eukaryotic-like serine/threonine-protein kinase